MVYPRGMLGASGNISCTRKGKIMRTLTDSELDAVAGGATLALNAKTAGVAGLAVGAPATVTALINQTVATAPAAGAGVAFGAGNVTLAPLTGTDRASILLTL
jgi:hypothetical protein